MQVLPEEGAQEGGLQKDEGRHRCRQVRQERQAKGCQCTHRGRLDTAFTARELRTKPDKHHPTATGGADVLQSDASPCKNLVHQHDHAGPEDSYGCKLGRSRIRVIGFWIRLDILSNRLCRRSSIAAKTYQPANFEQRHCRQRGMHWSKTSRVSAWEWWTVCCDVARRKCDEFDHLYRVTHGSEHRGETRKERE